jgi:hypothetical protein
MAVLGSPAAPGVAASALAPAAAADTDWVAVGMLLALVGGLLLANAVLFLGPRRRIGERLGGARSELRALRDAVFLRVQTALGFLFLIAGLAVQLYGRLAGSDGAVTLPFWAGGVVLALIVLEIAGWWASHALFRRALREHFLQTPPDFETEIALAREVGALFDMKSRADETVSSYAERLRRELGLPTPGRRERALQPDDLHVEDDD